MQELVASLTSLLTNAPVYIVWLVGIIIAFSKLKGRQDVAWLLAGGLGLHFVVGMISRFVFTMLPRQLMDSGTSAAELTATLAGLSLVFSVVAAGAWGLVIAAVIRGRDNREPIPDA